MKASRIRILRWRPYKLVFIALVVLPFLPALARSAANRCFSDRQICLAADRVSEFVAAALQASFRRGYISIAVAVGWLVVCYLALSLGWRKRITSRLLLAFAVTLIFAFFPYFVPVREFGITDGPGQILLIQIWLTFIGFPIGYTAFLFYVVLSGLGTEP